MRYIPTLTVLSALALSACAGSIATDYAAIVGMIQTNWPVVASDLPPSTNITTITNLVKGLSATSAPTSIGAVATDIAALLPSIPTCAPGVTKQSGCLTTQTKSDITLAVALLSTSSTLASIF